VCSVEDIDRIYIEPFGGLPKKVRALLPVFCLTSPVISYRARGSWSRRVIRAPHPLRQKAASAPQANREKIPLIVTIVGQDCYQAAQRVEAFVLPFSENVPMAR
jgi:hypothetical protein